MHFMWNFICDTRTYQFNFSSHINLSFIFIFHAILIFILFFSVEKYFNWSNSNHLANVEKKTILNNKKEEKNIWKSDYKDPNHIQSPRGMMSYFITVTKLWSTRFFCSALALFTWHTARHWDVVVVRFILFFFILINHLSRSQGIHEEYSDQKLRTFFLSLSFFPLCSGCSHILTVFGDDF